MPLTRLDLRKYLAPVFIETGTWRGHGVQRAKEAGFKQIYTMDIDCAETRKTFKRLSSDSCVHMYVGTSAEILPAILKDIPYDSVTFWLDAHPPGVLSLDDGVPGRVHAPILTELQAIKKYLVKFSTVTVLIDDMRLFTEHDRKRLASILSSMANGVTLSIDNGIVDNDVLVAKYIRS